MSTQESQAVSGAVTSSPPAGLQISTDRARLDVDLIHDFLSRSSDWAQGRSRGVVERSLAHSLCFGAYLDGRQVGFGRVITDYSVFGNDGQVSRMTPQAPRPRRWHGR